MRFEQALEAIPFNVASRLVESHLRGDVRQVRQWARAWKVPRGAVKALTDGVDDSPLRSMLSEWSGRIRRHEWRGFVERTCAAQSSVTGRVARREKVSPRAFLEQFYAPGRPVVLTQMMGWPAERRWTSEYLKRRCGRATVDIVDHRDEHALYDMQVRTLSRPIRFGEYVDWVEQVGTSNQRYLVANNNGLGRKGMKPLLEDLRFLRGIQRPDALEGRVYLWYGPGGTVTPLHHDTTNILFAQVRGRKRFGLVSPAHAELLRDCDAYYSYIDLERPDLARFPYLRELTVHWVTLAPGQMLFLPAGWWHHVRSLSTSLSVSMTNFVWPNRFAE